MAPKKSIKMPFGSKSEMTGGPAPTNSLIDKVFQSNKAKTAFANAEDSKPSKISRTNLKRQQNVKKMKTVAFNQDKSQFAIIWKNEIQEIEIDQKQNKKKKSENDRKLKNENIDKESKDEPEYDGFSLYDSCSLKPILNFTTSSLLKEQNISIQRASL